MARRRPGEELPPYVPGSSNGKDDEDSGFIGGMPDDYTVPRVRTGPYSARGGEQAAHWNGPGPGGSEDRTPGGIRGAAPLYSDGDEWGPASAGPAAIGELQAMMAASGLLGDDWRYGIWDEPSRDAYKALLAEANGSGITAEQALQMRAQSQNFPGSGGGSGSGGSGGGGGHWGVDPETGEPVWVGDQYVPPPLQVRTTNPKDLERVMRAAVIDTMGEGWSQAQIRELVSAYNWKEIQVQKDAYDQQVAIERSEFEGGRGAGGEVTSEVSMASPEAFVEDELMRRDPEGYQAGKMTNEAIPMFLQALEGWV